MTKMPKRLLIFLFVTGAVCLFGVVKGLAEEGEARIAYAGFGGVGLAAIIFFIYLVVRNSNR